MPLKASQLPSFLGRRVVVQEDLTGRGDAGDDYREVEGKVTVATTDGLVVQTRRSVVMIQARHILDVEELTHYVRLVRRWLKPVTRDSVKQHLLDRHGFPYDLVAAKEIDPKALLDRHDKIDHTNLGHNHGEKPPSRRGRKPKGYTQAPAQRDATHDEIVDEESED